MLPFLFNNIDMKYIVDNVNENDYHLLSIIDIES
jgi:hypothetical protein